jgi:hypothetical protein
MEWLPIESAPKDGTHILIFEVPAFEGDEQMYVVGRWSDFGWTESYADEYAICSPTHWMPLPPPPKTEGE